MHCVYTVPTFRVHCTTLLHGKDAIVTTLLPLYMRSDQFTHLHYKTNHPKKNQRPRFSRFLGTVSIGYLHIDNNNVLVVRSHQLLCLLGRGWTLTITFVGRVVGA